MEKVFIYWDNSSIFHGAQLLAEEREQSPGARYRVRIRFENLYRLAHADRHVESVRAAGLVPPSLQLLRSSLGKQGVKVELFDREMYAEQEAPNQMLQLRMLEDAIDYGNHPGTAVLLSGDGAGFSGVTGFHANLNRMHQRGWRIEVLSWKHGCGAAMMEWAKQVGKFVALDDFYEEITSLNQSGAGRPFAPARTAVELDISRRPV